MRLPSPRSLKLAGVWVWAALLVSWAVAVPPGAQARQGELMAEVVRRVQHNHVDAGTVVTSRLLDSALWRASEVYPSVIVTGASRAGANAITRQGTDSDPAASQGPWRLRAGDAVFLIGARDAVSWSGLSDTLARVLAFLTRVLPDTGAADVEATLVAGLLDGVDPHTEFFTPRAYREFLGSTTGDIAGIGLVVTQRDGIRVEEVLPGAPGERAGIRAGDRIVEVGPHFADALTMDDAVALLRGEPGQPIDIGVLSEGERTPRRVRVVRAAIHFPAAEGELLVYPEGNYGYIRLRAFQPDSTDTVRRLAAPWLHMPKAPLGIMLDLRGNPGGGLSQAIDISDLFLQAGAIVKTVQPNRGGQTARAEDGEDDIRLPVVVLIDRRSASASEIVAAALKNHNRAVLIGERTVGKGTVQTVFPLSAGHALKLTIAKYLTPGDRDIQGVGVTPHLLLRGMQAGPDAFHLRPGADPRENGEASPLAAPPGLKADAPLTVVPVLMPPGAAISEYGDTGPAAGDADAAFTLARDVLNAHGGRDPGGLLATALGVAHAREQAYDRQVAERLLGQGIDWRAGAADADPAPSGLGVTRVQAQFSAEGDTWRDGTEGASPGERIRLTLTVNNSGEIPVPRVLALLHGLSSHEPDWEIPLGWVKPGGSVTRSAEFVLPEGILPPFEPIELTLVSQGTNPTTALLRDRLFVPVREAGHILYTARIAVEEEGDGDGLWERGESLRWSLRLVNASALPLPGGRLLVEWPRPGIAAVLQDWPTDLPYLNPNQPWSAEALLRRVSGEPLASETIAVRARARAPDAVPLEWRVPIAPELPRAPLEFVPPEVVWTEPPPPRAGRTFTLRGQARDDQGARTATIFVNGRKTHYFAATGGRPAVPFQAELVLDPGWNRIQVEARDGDDLVTRRAFGVWSGDTTALTLATGAP